MNELLKIVIRELIEAAFQIVTGPGSHDEKAAKLKRATLALTSEHASDELIRAALSGNRKPNTGT